MTTTWRGRFARGVLLAGTLLLAAAPIQAQVRPGGPPTEARERLERQVRERFESLIQEELGIDESTATALREVVDGFAGDRRALSQRQNELRRGMRSSGTLFEASEAQAVLDELIAVQRDEVDLLEREQEALLTILSPPQLVRFYTLRERFGERVRNLRGRPGAAARGGRSGGQAGGPVF